MLSMSMKSQAEVFSQPIHMKQQPICPRENPNDLADGEEASWIIKSNNNNSIDTGFFPYHGTSFPPGRCAHQDEMLHSKFHSESDLAPGSTSLAIMPCKNSNNDHFSSSLDSSIHPKKCNSMDPNGSESSSNFDCPLITQVVEGPNNPVSNCVPLKSEQQQEQFYQEPSKNVTPMPEQTSNSKEDNKKPTNETKEDNLDDFEESVRVTVDYKHKIAHSKLNALLALLDRNKGQQNDITSNLRNAKTTSLPNTATSQVDSPTKLHSAYKNPSSDLTSSKQEFMGPTPLQKQSSKSNQTKTRSEDDNNRLKVDDKPENLLLIQRASSLKSGKTPPNNPTGHCKIVRFADVLGLDLANVKTFLDEVPKVPKSAYKDLKNAELSGLESDSSPDSLPPAQTQMLTEPLIASSSMPSSDSATTLMMPMFNQPGNFANFFDLLHDRKVCIENAFMGNPNTLRGTIRVQNVGFEKKVTIRYTTNEWAKCIDLEATYISGSCDGFSDKFTFVLNNLDSLKVGQRLQFCVKYETNGIEFWDNNNGKNYIFQCLSKTNNKPKDSLPISTPSVNRIQNQNYTVPHSPSALSDEPWLRYL